MIVKLLEGHKYIKATQGQPYSTSHAHFQFRSGWLYKSVVFTEEL